MKPDPAYPLSRMAMGKRRRDRQPTMWVPTTELPTSASHPFYARLNQLLRDKAFDDFAEARCASFYAATMGRPGLAPGPGSIFACCSWGTPGGWTRNGPSPGGRRIRSRSGTFSASRSPTRRRIIRRSRAPGGSSLLRRIETCLPGCWSDWARPVWSTGRRLRSMRRRSKPTRPCDTSCAATRAKATSSSYDAGARVGH